VRRNVWTKNTKQNFPNCIVYTYQTRFGTLRGKMFMSSGLAQVMLWRCGVHHPIYNIRRSEIVSLPGHCNWEDEWADWRKSAVKEFQALFVMQMVTTS